MIDEANWGCLACVAMAKSKQHFEFASVSSANAYIRPKGSAECCSEAAHTDVDNPPGEDTVQNNTMKTYTNTNTPHQTDFVL